MEQDRKCVVYRWLSPAFPKDTHLVCGVAGNAAHMLEGAFVFGAHAGEVIPRQARVLKLEVGHSESGAEEAVHIRSRRRSSRLAGLRLLRRGLCLF